MQIGSTYRRYFVAVATVMIALTWTTKMADADEATDNLSKANSTFLELWLDNVGGLDQDKCQKVTLAQVRDSLDSGADVNVKTNVIGYTGLMGAASGGNMACITYMVAHGADTNAKNILKETPLMFSSVSGSLTCVKYFVSKGGVT